MFNPVTVRDKQKFEGVSLGHKQAQKLTQIGQFIVYSASNCHIGRDLVASLCSNDNIVIQWVEILGPTIKVIKIVIHILRHSFSRFVVLTEHRCPWILLWIGPRQPWISCGVREITFFTR
jgi:hypothetical protein